MALWFRRWRRSRTRESRNSAWSPSPWKSGNEDFSRALRILPFLAEPENRGDGPPFFRPASGGDLGDVPAPQPVLLQNLLFPRILRTPSQRATESRPSR